MTEEAIRAQIDALGADNPTFATALQQLLDSDAFTMVSIYAFGFDGITMIGNLVGTEIPIGNLTMDAARPILEAQFKQLGGTGLTWSDQDLDLGPVTVLDMSLEVEAPTGSITLTDRIFFFLDGGTLYELTFTCMAGGLDGCLADADAIAATWSVTD